MRLFSNTALGIDISAARITLALLAKTKEGLELVSTASSVVPEGAIVGGNIEKPALLARAIKEMQHRNRMYARSAAVSLFARPVLMQLMDMPARVPSNINQYVEGEVKNYVVLPSREITFDFCSVGSAGRQGQNRIFVVAAESKKVTDFASALTAAGVCVGAVEPYLVAYTRALYAKKIAGKFNRNVLIAVARDNDLTLTVFKGQNLDFIRTKELNEYKNRPEEFIKSIASEINIIKQFYDIEVPDNSGKWDVLLIVDDPVQLPQDAEKMLRADAAVDSLQIATDSTLLDYIQINRKQTSSTAAGSAAAVGLAMKALEKRKGDLKINLMPQQLIERRILKKDALVLANVAAAALLVMIVIIAWLSIAIGSATKRVVSKKQRQLSTQVYELLKERDSAEKKIKKLSSRLEQATNILNMRRDPNWLNVLSDIADGTPKSVRITKLSSKGSKLLLEGAAMSYDSVYMFMDKLNKSELISSASLMETEKADKDMVKYAIRCSLAGQSRKN